MPEEAANRHGAASGQPPDAGGSALPDWDTEGHGFGYSYRIFVFVLLGMVVKAFSSIFQFYWGSEAWAVETCDLLALVLLSVPPVYVAQQLKRQRGLRRAILLAVALVLAGQLLEFMNGFAWFELAPAVGSPDVFWRSIHQILNLFGLTLLVVSFVIALLDIQASNRRERAERRRLAEQIAERNRAEEGRRRSEERLRGILSSLHKSAIVVHARDGEYLNAYLAPDIEAALGRPADSLVGGIRLSSMRSEDHEARLALIRAVFDSGIPAQQTAPIDSSRGLCWCETNFAPMRDSAGEIVAVVGFVRDISEQHEAQARQQESEVRYRALFDSASDALFVCSLNENGRIESIDEVNEQACRMFGYTRDQLLDLKAEDLCDPDHLDVLEALFQQIASTGSAIMEASGRRADGHCFAAEVTAQGIELNGRSALLASIRDIHERKHREEETRRLATVIEQAGEAIIIADGEGAIRYVNPAFVRDSGHPAVEVVGMPLVKLHESGRAESPFREAWEQVTRGETWRGTFVDRRKDGSEYRVATTLSPIRDPESGSVSYVETRRDVTHETLLESQLRQALKLEAIGTLAAGIAHDFKNILSLILGYAEMAQQNTESETARTYIRRIMKAGLRARGLIHQILIFSRQVDPERRLVPLHDVVDEALRLFSGSLTARVRLRRHLSSDAGMVLADPTQIQQVVLNLCTNACQAMREEGGLLEVTLRQATKDDLTTPGAPETSDDYALLMVRDTGKGVSPEVLDRIFDPFFTTKSHGEGTGLGLSVVHGIVTGLGGTITVDSAPGQGALFRVSFPCAGGVEEAIVPDESQPLPRGTEHLLIVDDEKDVAEMMRDVLESLGYHVTAFNRASEALAAVRSDAAAFQGAIVDYAMPGASGIDFAVEFIAECGGRPLILTTAFDNLPDLESLQPYGIRAVLPKPFSRHLVAATVRRVLDEAAGKTPQAETDPQ